MNFIYYRGEGWQFGRKCYSLPNHYERSQLSDSKQWPPLAQLAHLGSAQVSPFHQSLAALRKRKKQDVNADVFHQRLKSIKIWFGEFSDAQRNRLLSDILVSSSEHE